MSFIRSVRDTIDAGRGLGPHLVLACIVSIFPGWVMGQL
jgi:hypothetical protein